MIVKSTEYIKHKLLSIFPSSLRFYLLKSDINKKIAEGSFWSLCGAFVSKGLLLLSSIIIARILGPDIYGETGIIRSTVNMFTAFAGMGLGLTATKYIAEHKKDNIQKVLKIITLSNFIAFLSGLLFCVLIIVFSSEIAIQISAPHLQKEIKIGALMLFFNSLNGVQAGILAGFENFKSIAKNNVWAGIISFFVQIIATYIWGLTGAIIGFGTNFFILWALNKYSISKIIGSKKINIWDKSILTEINILWKFSLPAVLSGIMVGPITWVCNTILVNQAGGYTQMALFDIANQWRMTILFIPGALSQIILPMLSSSLKNKDNYKNILLKNLKLNALISVLMFLLIAIISPLISRFYGNGFQNISAPLLIMTFTTLLVAINNVVGQAIASQGKMWMGFLLNTLWAIILVIGAYITIHIYELGAIGLSISFLCSYIVHMLSQTIYLRLSKNNYNN
jgi:O-antigen/teichoic acid export membrane protein